MIGRTASHYRILEKLGQGGMGEVFLAQDTSLDRKVALKFLPEELRLDPVAHKRLLREAKADGGRDIARSGIQLQISQDVFRRKPQRHVVADLRRGA